MLPVGLGLKLLGIWNPIKEFFKNNWKWIVPLILVVLFYFFITDKINDAREEGYTAGIAFEKSEQAKRVAIENESNRKFEAMLNTSISKFGRKAVEEAIQRVSKETVYKEKITTMVRDNPIYQDCKVEQEVLDARNEIRRLGPQDYPIRVKIEN